LNRGIDGAAAPGEQCQVTEEETYKMIKVVAFEAKKVFEFGLDDKMIDGKGMRSRVRMTKRL
jgi:hypothetical protein